MITQTRWSHSIFPGYYPAPLIILALLAALMLVAAACGTADTTPAASPTPTSTPASTTATPFPTASPTLTPTPGAKPDDNGIAEAGEEVSVHYVGTLDSGEVFDTSRERDQPLSFVLGAGRVITGFDQAVTGMAVGDMKTVRLSSEDAYGPRRDELVVDIPTDQAPDGLSAGDSVRLQSGQPARVLEVTEDHVRIDANHPLAGQALTFEIELVGIK